MNASWGKVRIGVVALIGVVAFVMVALHRSSDRAFSADPPALFVTDFCSEAVTAYPVGSNGDVTPLAPGTGLSLPQSATVDNDGNIYVTNFCSSTITIYAKGSNGNVTPIATIGGTNTGLSLPTGIALDSGGNIYVANSGGVLVFPALGNNTGLLNEAPIASISGGNTGLTSPQNIALDSSGKIYVVDEFAVGVFIYPAGSNGDVFPLATISGTNTGLIQPHGIALDSARKIYVADLDAASVLVYAAVGSSTGTLNEAPIATISGNNTGLAGPQGIALDSNGVIYVSDAAVRLLIYPSLGSSTGQINETPTATISGSNTDLSVVLGIALDSNANIYAVDEGSASVTVYQPLGSSTGMLDEAPTAAISTTLTTAQGFPEGIALDSSGKIYVANTVPSSVTVYPAGSSANTAPLATISGNNTGLSGPEGLALDSSGKIYVAGGNGLLGEQAVLIYPALGGSTGLINEAPVAAISGSNTGLDIAKGIALDASGKIYVADEDSNSVFVYSALGSSTGTLNEAPIATISGSNTGLDFPDGLALDTSGKIYVVNDGGVFIYPPLGSSTGVLNEAPIASITGSNTGFEIPTGIALDSNSNIYVADLARAIFVYPPLGTSTGELNEAPVATISGPQTGLGEPQFIAIQSGAGGPTPTATTTNGATPTATATSMKTATPTATKTPTPTATATSLGACGPNIQPPRFMETLITNAKTGKPPKLASVKFPNTTLGNSSTRSETLTNSTGAVLSVTSVGTSGNVFSLANDSICVGQLPPGASCTVPLTFTPTSTTHSKGELNISTSAGTLNAALTGAGVGPKVTSLSAHSASPFSNVSFNGSGFAATQPVLVNFSEKAKGQKTAVTFSVPAIQNQGNSIQVIVPPIFSPLTHQLVAGTAKVSLQELLITGPINLKSPPLQITALNGGSPLTPGEVTDDFVTAESNFAAELAAEVPGTALAGLQDSLESASSSLSGLLEELTSQGGPMLGNIGTTPIDPATADLQTADNQILAMLSEIATSSGASSGRPNGAAGNGCLATEAAQALADVANPQAFANDIATFFQHSQSSPACTQPGPAIATLGIVNGTSGVALSITAQFGNVAVQPLLPSQALLLANLAPGGQLLSTGATLAQTSTRGQQQVLSVVAIFNRAANQELNTVIENTSGPLQNNLVSIGQGQTSITQSVTPPTDDSYSGTFTGTQFFTGGSCGVNGSLAFSVSGTSIAVTGPAAGSGSLDLNSGSGGFTLSGISEPGSACSFGGSFTQSSLPTVSGTWSCSTGSAGAGFVSANGTWSATGQ
jgi:sugar lactone lactonase YvrE